MLIELNCFFTLLCSQRMLFLGCFFGYVKLFFIGVGVDVQTIRFSKLFRFVFASLAKRRENFIMFSPRLCVHQLHITNLSSFQKSELWIYQFLRSRCSAFVSCFLRFTLRRCGMLIARLLHSLFHPSWRDEICFENWGWQAFSGERKCIGLEKRWNLVEISYF